MPCSRFVRSLGGLILLPFVGLLLSCGAGGESGHNKNPTLSLIVITPANPLMAKGTNLQLSAIGSYDDGTKQVLTSVAWQTSQSAVATINRQGDITAAGQGTAQVSASYQGVTGRTSVTVGPPTLVSVAVTPNPSSLPKGESEQLTATGTLSDGTVQDLTKSVTWSSSGSGIASVNATGSANAIAVGSTTITASAGSVTGSANLTVTPAVAVSLNISPATVSIALGGHGQFEAIATWSDGTTQNVTGIAQWSSTQVAIASISSNGLATAQQVGSTTIMAQTSNLTAVANLTVGPPALVSIAVTPNPSSLPKGESEQLAATGTLSDGTVQDLTKSVTWSSSGSGIASVNATGSANAIAVGSTTITASAGSVTGSANLTVTPAVAVFLNISPATVSIVLEGHSQFQAIETWSDGTTQNVTGTAAWSSTQVQIATISSSGLATAQQVGSTTIMAQTSNLTASANLTVVPLMLLNYFDRASAEASGIDGTIRLTNPGVTFGNLCAMVYVLDQAQTLSECCGCSVSDSGLLSMSLLHDLTGNPLTGKKSHAGTILVVPSDIGPNPQCDPSSLSPTGVLLGWGTNVQPPSNGTPQVTETDFELVALSNGSATKLANECGFIEQSGGGQGICSCGTGK